ncbi:hypothetical protein [Zestomonas insulae]|nr:hypothetical protein [Pseudomonas insulae]
MRHGVRSVVNNMAWRAAIDMLWALERQFAHWRIDFGVPGEALLGELIRSDQLSANWPNLQVLNSQGCNVQLSLSSQDSWLHLAGVTEADFEQLRRQGMVPTIRFTAGGVTEVYLHVNFGCESPSVMARLAEQVQGGLQATVQAHIGGVSFPLPGFDRWQGGQLQHCSDVHFHAATIGRQLSEPLRQLKGAVGRARFLGAPTRPSPAASAPADEVGVRKTQPLQEDLPHPSGH